MLTQTTWKARKLGKSDLCTINNSFYIMLGQVKEIDVNIVLKNSVYILYNSIVYI